MTWKARGMEALAVVLVLATIFGVPVAVRAYDRHVVQQRAQGTRVIELCANGRLGAWLQHPVGGWNYFRTEPKPGPIRMKIGEPVLFRVTSVDVHHSFSIPELRIVPHDVTPGRWTEILVQPDEPGTYSVLCYTVCGEKHIYMDAELDVAGDPK